MPDSNSSNGEVLTQVLKKMRSGEKIAPSEFQDFVKAQNDPDAWPPQFAHHSDAHTSRQRPAVELVEGGADPRLELLRGLDGRGLAAHQRFEQALFGKAPAPPASPAFYGFSAQAPK